MYDAHLTLIVSDFDSNQTCEPELANFCLFTVVLHPCDPHSSSSLLNRSGAHMNLSSCLILLHIKGFGFPLWVFSALGSRDDRLVTCHCHSDTFGIGSAMIILCAKSLTSMLLLTSTIKSWSRRSRLSLSIISRISTWAQDKQYSNLAGQKIKMALESMSCTI